MVLGGIHGVIWQFDCSTKSLRVILWRRGRLNLAHVYIVQAGSEAVAPFALSEEPWKDLSREYLFLPSRFADPSISCPFQMAYQACMRRRWKYFAKENR
jgi:hypothetical protein